LTPTDRSRGARAAGAGRYVRRSSLRAAMLVLLALDAFVLGSLVVGVMSGGHHGAIFWIALVPLVALGSYLVWRTVRVWRQLRRL
jgi:hypothetical protein